MDWNRAQLEGMSNSGLYFTNPNRPYKSEIPPAVVDAHSVSGSMQNPNPNPNPTSPSSSWADLPHDVLSVIMKKVGAVDVLLGAQFVCRPWRKASFDPSLWRIIDMTNAVHGYCFFEVDLEEIAREAIRRAQGRIEKFSAEGFSSDGLLSYLADRTSDLRCVRLISAYDVYDEGLAEVVGRLPLLEELELTFSSYTENVFKLIGEACPHLKCFRYNRQGNRSKRYQDDTDAFGIANYMPALRQLQIVGNWLTNKGLLAILDNCVHLQSLDLRGCFYVDLDASVRAKCVRIKDLRLPNDVTNDYRYTIEFEAVGHDDDSDRSQDTDIDAFYDEIFHDYYDYSEEDYEDYSDYDYLVDAFASNSMI